MTEYQVGELVDIAIKGARVELMPAAEPDTSWLAVTVDVAGHSLDLPLSAPGVTVTRVAPPEWPPQAGDVWAAAHGVRWMVATGPDVAGTLEMYASTYAAVCRPDQWLDVHGPGELVYRDGWTPAAEPKAAPAAEPKAAPAAEPKAAPAAGLRALADILDAHRQLPTRYLTIHYCMGVEDGGLAALQAWAEALNVEVRDAGLDSNRRRHHNVDADLSGLSMHLFYIDSEPEPVDEPAPEPLGAEVPALNPADCDGAWHSQRNEPIDACPTCGATATFGAEVPAEPIPCAYPGDQEHDHRMCEDVAAEAAGEDEPRCDECGEPLRLIESGAVGHCGDARGAEYYPAELGAESVEDGSTGAGVQL